MRAPIQTPTGNKPYETAMKKATDAIIELTGAAQPGFSDIDACQNKVLEPFRDAINKANGAISADQLDSAAVEEFLKSANTLKQSVVSYMSMGSTAISWENLDTHNINGKLIEEINNGLIDFQKNAATKNLLTAPAQRPVTAAPAATTAKSSTTPPPSPSTTDDNSVFADLKDDEKEKALADAIQSFLKGNFSAETFGNFDSVKFSPVSAAKPVSVSSNNTFTTSVDIELNQSSGATQTPTKAIIIFTIQTTPSSTTAASVPGTSASKTPGKTTYSVKVPDDLRNGKTPDEIWKMECALLAAKSVAVRCATKDKNKSISITINDPSGGTAPARDKNGLTPKEVEAVRAYLNAKDENGKVFYEEIHCGSLNSAQPSFTKARFDQLYPSTSSTVTVTEQQQVSRSPLPSNQKPTAPQQSSTNTAAPPTVATGKTPPPPPAPPPKVPASFNAQVHANAAAANGSPVFTSSQSQNTTTAAPSSAKEGSASTTTPSPTQN